MPPNGNRALHDGEYRIAVNGIVHWCRVAGARHRGVPLVHVPTIVIVGLYDRNSGVDVNRDVATLIPQAELALFAQSAHFPDVDEPDRYATTIKTFLSE
jgi:pimeloyl-ACP methyl ester carboxylesterase